MTEAREQSSAPGPPGGISAPEMAPARPTGGESLIRLNLGCGPSLLDGYVNVDLVPLPGVDVVCDLDERWPWDDGTVSEIIASHLYEHVRDPLLFMSEAWRVLADDGILDIRVPGGHYVAAGYWLPHQHAFTDPTHLRQTSPLSFDYWVPGRDLHKAYGYEMGSQKGGPRFDYEQLSVVGEQGEEMRAVLRKLGPDWSGDDD